MSCPSTTCRPSELSSIRSSASPPDQDRAIRQCAYSHPTQQIHIESCIALSGLTEEEIEAIAEHEHIPEMLAIELGSYLANQPNGQEHICRIFADDIRAAQERGDLVRVVRLKLVLRHFLEHHEPAA